MAGARLSSSTSARWNKRPWKVRDSAGTGECACPAHLADAATRVKVVFRLLILSLPARTGVPGESCTSGYEANRYERSMICHEERSIRRSRS
jgi:hypothetical protein